MKLIEYLTTNFYIYLSFLKKALKRNKKQPEVDKINHFLKTSSCTKIFKIKGSQIKLLNKNNTFIELTFCKILRKISKPIKSKIEQLIKEVQVKSFSESLSLVIDLFQ